MAAKRMGSSKSSGSKKAAPKKSAKKSPAKSSSMKKSMRSTKTTKTKASAPKRAAKPATKKTMAPKKTAAPQKAMKPAAKPMAAPAKKAAKKSAPRVASTPRDMQPEQRQALSGIVPGRREPHAAGETEAQSDESAPVHIQMSIPGGTDETLVHAPGKRHRTPPPSLKGVPHSNQMISKVKHSSMLFRRNG